MYWALLPHNVTQSLLFKIQKNDATFSNCHYIAARLCDTYNIFKNTLNLTLKPWLMLNMPS